MKQNKKESTKKLEIRPQGGHDDGIGSNTQNSTEARLVEHDVYFSHWGKQSRLRRSCTTILCSYKKSPRPKGTNFLYPRAVGQQEPFAGLQK